MQRRETEETIKEDGVYRGQNYYKKYQIPKMVNLYNSNMTNKTIPFWEPGISDSFKENEKRKAIAESERLRKKIKEHEEKKKKQEEDRIKAEEDKKIKENRDKFQNFVGGMEI